MLTLELSDELYSVVQHQAEIAGTSPPSLVAMLVERQYCQRQTALVPATEEARQVARARFERHFGEVDLGQATGTENDQIDVDLAREYAATHEEL